MNSLKSGFLWNILSAVGRQGMMLLGTIILAHLLSPEDYGLIGMLTIFITISETIIDAGLGGAIIKKKIVHKIDYDTLTTYNIAVSIFLYFVIFIIAPIVSSFYSEMILLPLLRIYGVTIVIESFSIGPKIYMMKNLLFKEYAITNFFAGVLGLLGSIILALLGFGVYSIVYQYIIMAMSFLVIAFWFTHYRFNLDFSLSSFKELFTFGFFTTFANIIKNFSDSIFTNFYAKFAPLSSVGYYNQSFKLQGSVLSIQNTVIDSFIYPIFCKKQDDINEIAVKINGLVSLGIIFLNTFLIINSQHIISLLLGTAWLPMSNFFCFFLVAGIFQAKASLNRTILKALGEIKNILLIEIFSLICVFIVLFVIYCFFDLSYIVYGLLICSFLKLVFSWFFIYIDTSMPIKMDIFDFLLMIIVSMISYTFINLFFNSLMSDILAIVINLIIQLFLTLLMLYLIKAPSFFYLLNILSFTRSKNE